MSQPTSLNEKFVQWLQETYKELHRHPELGMDLRWTTDYVRHEAEKLGFKTILIPKNNTKGINLGRYKINIVEVAKVEEAFKHLFG